MEQRRVRQLLRAAGVDEAGRGCLAGPVVAGAVILSCAIPGLADSKKLTPLGRARLEPVIKSKALCWSVGVVWPGVIDRINILQATFVAMAKACSSLARRPELLLIDGNQALPHAVLARFWPGNPPGQRAIIRGDALVPAISAASILAKTFRDRLMEHLARRWPGYGFEKHKGYPVPAHYAALARLGPCPLHRLTFRGVTDAKPKA